MALCAKPNGSYSSFCNSEEADLRFVYAAVVICHTLGDFSQMDRPRVTEYIRSCRNFDGGYGLRPQCESHSGAIYCAVAALKLLGEAPLQPKRTLHFLASRQTVNLSSKPPPTQTISWWACRGGWGNCRTAATASGWGQRCTSWLAATC